MSIVLITHHDENIYDITKTSGEEDQSAPRHMTKFDKIVEKEHKIKPEDKRYGTMGPPEYPPPDPKAYLKKRTWKPPMRIPSQPGKYQACGMKKVPIPHPEETIKEYKERLKAISKKRNFIAENVKYVLTLKPKEPQKRLVVDCHGESKDINRGLEPQFINSANFGKTPNYLKHFQVMREKRMQLKKDIIVAEKPKCRYITKDEREELLAV